jgi:predicted metal-binding protein
LVKELNLEENRKFIESSEKKQINCSGTVATQIESRHMHKISINNDIQMKACILKRQPKRQMEELDHLIVKEMEEEYQKKCLM